MAARKFGRIVNITSGSVKMPLVGLDLSSGARAGLTAFLAGIARSVAASNVTINFLLPGTFETDRCARISKRTPRTGVFPSSRRWRNGWRRCPPGDSALRRNSAPPAPFSALPRPATSPGKISCSTAARFPAASELSSRNGTKENLLHNQQDSGSATAVPQGEQGRHMPASSHPPRNRSRWHSTAGRGGSEVVSPPGLASLAARRANRVHGGNLSPVVAQNANPKSRSRRHCERNQAAVAEKQQTAFGDIPTWHTIRGTARRGTRGRQSLLAQRGYATHDPAPSRRPDVPPTETLLQ